MNVNLKRGEFKIVERSSFYQSRPYSLKYSKVTLEISRLKIRVLV